MSLIASTPAWATDCGLPLHQTKNQQTVTAHDFQTHNCDQIPGGKAQAGLDGWVFVLPDNKTEFKSITLTFKDGNKPPINFTIIEGAQHDNTYPNGITDNGTSKAYIVTPAGWTLTDGTAHTTGATKADFFNLTDTCPALETKPQPSQSVAGTPTPTPTSPVTQTTAPAPSASSSAPPTATHDGTLPITGAQVGGLIVVSVGLIGAGATFLLMRRRRYDFRA